MLSLYPRKFQIVLDHLNYSAAMLGMRFARSECKMLLYSWIILNPGLAPSEEVIGIINNVSHRYLTK